MVHLLVIYMCKSKVNHIVFLNVMVIIYIVTLLLRLHWHYWGGGEVEVPTLNGKVSLIIAPETHTGKMFRLRGKGIQSLRGSKMGDLYCHVMVETHVNLTGKQKELLKELGKSFEADKSCKHSSKEKTFLIT